MMEQINIGVIGCGHWGPNHVRNFSTLSGSSVLACADSDPLRLKAIRRPYPGLVLTEDYRVLLDDPRIHAVVVATPTETHAAIAGEALEAGKHVLVEKPLALSTGDCRRLQRLANGRSLVLMVGHTFLFNAGIRKLKDHIASGASGVIYSIHVTRTNLGPIRRDVGVVWDLASHDVSILNYLLDATPVEVTARAECFLRKGIEDVAFISLCYPNRVLANIRVSWLDPQKVRQITVTGSKKMLTWDDLAATGPVMIYDKGVFAFQGGVVKKAYYANYGDFRLLTREGDVSVPHVKQEEPLRIEAAHFLDCIRGQPNTLSGPQSGLDVARVLTAVQQSIANRGRPVKVR